MKCLSYNGLKTILVNNGRKELKNFLKLYLTFTRDDGFVNKKLHKGNKIDHRSGIKTNIRYL